MGRPALDALPPLLVEGRVDRLRALMAEEGLDAFLVVHRPNVRWLTGFSGSNGSLLVEADRWVLFTDSRYREQAATETERAEAVGVEIRITRDLIEGGVGARLGIEAERLTVRQWRDLSDRFRSSELVDFDDRVETLRRRKDAAELVRLRAAAAIADDAFQAVWPMLSDGAGRFTEQAVAAALDHEMRSLGADAPSFETIVASGPNGALPHARPGTRPLSDGELVVMDFGARVDGYGSDMTRTVVAGRGPYDSARSHLHAAVTAAQAAGVAAVGAGSAERAIDRACREVLVGWEFGPLAVAPNGSAAPTAGLTSLADAFTHGTGHGIGLEIHEGPLLSSRADGILHDGLVITVEPGVYLPGFGGVRVEDSVVVTESGCEPITHSPKSLRPWSV